MDLKEAQLDGIVQRHPWELARKEVVQDILLRNMPNLRGEPQFVLDMGSGDTWLVEELSKHLPKAYFHAVDIAFEADQLQTLNARFSQEGLPIQALKSMEESMNSQVGKVDLVLLLDVIEHIEDDEKFLHYLSSHPGIGVHTTILITVPAYQGLFCSHDHFLEHFRRYTNGQLRSLLARVNMEPISIGYFFSSLLPLRIFQVIKEKILGQGKATGIGVWAGGKQKTSLLKKILINDYRIGKIFGHNLPGLSNFVVCRPSA